jgi:hypothetical protein
MSPAMKISFTALDDRGRDRADLVEFLTGHEFPFHATRCPARAVVEEWIDDGRFGDADHAAYWIDTDAGRIGLVVLKDSPTTPRCSTCGWPPSIGAKVSAPKCSTR